MNDLIDPTDPLKPDVTLLGVITDINDAGVIVSQGMDGRTGETQAYVLTPVGGK